MRGTPPHWEIWPKSSVTARGRLPGELGRHAWLDGPQDVDAAHPPGALFAKGESGKSLIVDWNFCQSAAIMELGVQGGKVGCGVRFARYFGDQK
jgi:hypothetical protein